VTTEHAVDLTHEETGSLDMLFQFEHMDLAPREVPLAFEERIQGDLPLLAVFGLGLVGVIYSAYLTYLEIAVIHAICPYCVASAVLITGVLLVSIARLVIVED
jgi:hypothetical protein